MLLIGALFANIIVALASPSVSPTGMPAPVAPTVQAPASPAKPIEQPAPKLDKPPTFNFEAGSPAAIVLNMVTRATSTQLSSAERDGDDKVYFTPDLNAAIASLPEGPGLDNDPVTGSQEPELYKIRDIATKIGQNIVVRVSFLYEDDKIDINYTMKQIANNWKVDDIEYVGSNGSSTIRNNIDELKRQDAEENRANKGRKGHLQPEKGLGAKSDGEEVKIKRLTVFRGRCRYQLIQGFFSCGAQVPYVELTNGRAFLTFTDRGTSFTVSGGRDRQPNLENFYQGLDTVRLVQNNKTKAEDNGMEGECHFKLNKEGTKFSFIKCDIYNRSKGTVYSFYLERIATFSRKDF